MAKVSSVHGGGRILPNQFVGCARSTLPSSNRHLTEPIELKDIFKIMS